MISVTAIGSCRISAPLRRAEARGRIRRSAGRVWGYTHTAAEALQQLRFLTGGPLPPPRLHPLILAGVNPHNLDGQFHDPAHVYLVEISSAKVVWAGEHAVQLNHVQKYFAPLLSDRLFAANFWRLAAGRAPARAERLALLADHPGWLDLSEADRDLISAITVEIETRQSLERRLQTLAHLLPATVVVTHCNALAVDGLPLASREALIAMTTEVAGDLGLPLVDPTAAMEEFGQERAILDQSGSLSHYTPEFEDYLFETALMPAIARAARVAEPA